MFSKDRNPDTYQPLFQKTEYIIGILLLLPFIFCISFLPYEKAYDEIFQLEAAVRLSVGNSYAASRNIPQDLSTPYFPYLSAWPVGYAFIISSLLRIGFSISLAAKAYKIILMFTAFHLWFRAGASFIKSTSIKKIFAGFLAVFIIISAKSVNDLFVITVTAWLTSFFTKLENTDTSVHPRGLIQKATPFLIAGTITGTCILMKYSAISIAFSGLMWLTINHYRSFKKYITNLTVFILPVIIITSVIFAINYRETKNISTLTTHINPQYLRNITHLPYVEHLKAAFLDNTQVLLIGIKGLSLYYPITATWLTYAILLLVFGLFIFSAIILWKKKATRTLVVWAIILYLSISSFLFFNTILFQEDVEHWTPFIEGRYLTPFAPLLILVILLAFDNRAAFEKKLSPFAKAASISLIMLIYVAIITGYTYRRFQPANEIARETIVIQKGIDSISAQTPLLPRLIFTDQSVFLFLPRTGNENVFNDFPDSSKHNYFAKETLVLVLGSYQQYYNIINPSDRNLEETVVLFTKRNGFAGVDLSAKTKIYWKIFKPGETLN
jgi:hypothetical protein